VSGLSGKIITQIAAGEAYSLLLVIILKVYFAVIDFVGSTSQLKIWVWSGLRPTYSANIEAIVKFAAQAVSALSTCRKRLPSILAVALVSSELC
jgi:hypothetical protein